MSHILHEQRNVLHANVTNKFDSKNFLMSESMQMAGKRKKYDRIKEIERSPDLVRDPDIQAKKFALVAGTV